MATQKYVNPYLAPKTIISDVVQKIDVELKMNPVKNPKLTFMYPPVDPENKRQMMGPPESKTAPRVSKAQRKMIEINTF